MPGDERLQRRRPVPALDGLRQRPAEGGDVQHGCHAGGRSQCGGGGGEELRGCGGGDVGQPCGCLRSRRCPVCRVCGAAEQPGGSYPADRLVVAYANDLVDAGGRKPAPANSGDSKKTVDEIPNGNRTADAELRTSGGIGNPATVTKLADDLAAQMPKPMVTNTQLAGLMDDLYRDGAKVGTGSTADAVRYEIANGVPVGGAFHTQKAQDYSKALQKWLVLNPKASFSDRSAAQNVYNDLQNSLKGK